MPRALVWTPDAVDYVRRLAREGKSGMQIASATGRSRNAVLGVCFRHGIMVKRARVYRATPARQKPVVELAATPSGPEGGILIHELTDSACHWPVHDQLPGRYCGAPTSGSSYCAHHHARAYRGFE